MERRLKDFCQVINGRAYKQEELLDKGKYRLLRVGNFFSSDRWYYSNLELDKNKYCESGDLLYAWSCSFGPRIWKEEKVIYHYHIWKLIPNTKVCDKTYLYYLLLLSTNKMIAGTHGSVMGHLTKNDMENFVFDLPSLIMQRKIASILSAIDSKIEINNEIMLNLESQAEAIYKSWFIDFDKTNGVLPESWKYGELSEIVNYVNGYAFDSKKMLKEPTKTSIDIFKQGHIARGGGFIFDGTKSWIEKENLSKLDSKYFLKRADILMAMTDMKDNVAILGNTALMPLNEQYVVNQRVALLQPKNEMGINYSYIYLTTNKNYGFLKELRSHANSGVQVNLSSDAIKHARILIPDKNTNLKFDELVRPMLEKCMDLQIQNAELGQLRDTLLPKLISGEIDAEEVEI